MCIEMCIMEFGIYILKVLNLNFNNLCNVLNFECRKNKENKVYILYKEVIKC